MIRRFMEIGDGLLAFMTAFAVGAAVLILATFFVARNISVHYDQAACNSFSDQANRETKFVTYTYWSWDCLTPTGDGKWISTHNLREFGEQP